jgi:lysozyme
MSLTRTIAGAIAATTARRVVAAAFMLSAAGTAGIVAHEGMVQKVYLDPIGIPTVCAGHINTVTKADVGKAFTREQCASLLQQDTASAQAGVKRLVTVPITQEQYDALVSFTFNLGEGSLRRSALLAKLNAGDCLGAGAEFPKWVYAGGRVLPGLVRRRADERRVFETGCQ